MELNTIENLIIIYTPLITTFIANVISFVNMFRMLRSIICENKANYERKDKEIEELRMQIVSLCNENSVLRQSIDELVVAITKVAK